MSNTLHAFDFLAQDKLAESSLLVLFGDDRFLKRCVLDKFYTRRLISDDSDINLVKTSGKRATLQDVFDELRTVSLFGGGMPRVVFVEEGDEFVSNYRTELEEWANDPPSQGILILDVDQWRSNTRLYKTLDKTGLQIDCNLPMHRKSIDVKKIAKWAAAWGKQNHRLKINPLVVEYMIELTSADLGLIDQNLAKLALYFDASSTISEESIDEYIGGWQTKTVWQVIDNAVNGQTGLALEQLDRLFHDGEVAFSLFGQISWSLRRYAMAFEEAQRYRRLGLKMNVEDVLSQAGFRFGSEKKKVLEQLKKIGREKGNQYYRLLLECDLALKGSHSQVTRARLALERLIFSLTGATSQLPAS